METVSLNADVFTKEQQITSSKFLNWGSPGTVKVWASAYGDGYLISLHLSFKKST